MAPEVTYDVLNIKSDDLGLEVIRQFVAPDPLFFSVDNRPTNDLGQRDVDLNTKVETRIHAVAADLTALKAIPDTGRFDGQLTTVNSPVPGLLYRFDAGSSADAVGNFIVVPDAGTGRWFLVSGGTGGVYVRLVSSTGDFATVAEAIDDYETRPEKTAIIFIEGAAVDAGAAGTHLTTKSNITFIGISQSGGAKSEIDFGTGVSAELRFDETVRVKFENLKFIRNAGNTTGRIRIGTGANRDNELVFKDCEFEDNATAAGTGFIDVNAPSSGQVTRIVLDGTFAVAVATANMPIFDLSNGGSGRFEFIVRNRSYVSTDSTTGSNHGDDVILRAVGAPDLTISVESHSFFGFLFAGWADPATIDFTMDGTATVVGNLMEGDVASITGENMWNDEWQRIADGGRAPTRVSIGPGTGNNFSGYISRPFGPVINIPSGTFSFGIPGNGGGGDTHIFRDGQGGITGVIGRTYQGSGMDETTLTGQAQTGTPGESVFVVASGQTNVKIKDMTLKVFNTVGALSTESLFKVISDGEAILLENIKLQYDSTNNSTGAAWDVGAAGGSLQDGVDWGVIMKNCQFETLGTGTMGTAFGVGVGTEGQARLEHCRALGRITVASYSLTKVEAFGCIAVLNEDSGSGAIGFNCIADCRLSQCRVETLATTAGKLFEGFRLVNKNQLTGCRVDGNSGANRRIEHGVVITGDFNIVHGCFIRRVEDDAVEVQSTAGFNIVNDNMFEDNAAKSVDEVGGSNNLNVNGNVSSGGTGYTTTGAQSIQNDNI